MRDVNNFNTIRGKRVLLYSGGLDSYIASALWKPDVNLYVDTGSRYSEKELAHLPKPPHGALVVERRRLDLSDCERADAIVPHRNAFLVLAAAYHGTEIALAATVGDRSCDKDQTFAERMTDLLNHIYQPSHWCPGGAAYRVCLPVKHNSKRELVQGYMSFGDKAKEISDLCSCYHPTEYQCGNCKPCSRKWVAEVLNGIVNPHYKACPADFFKKDEIAAAMAGRHRGDKEDADLVEALLMTGRLF